MFSTRLAISRASAVALLLAVALPIQAATAPASLAAKKRAAKVAITKVTVKGKKVTVAGRVTLPVNTARQRKRTRVALTLTGSTRKAERFTAKINSKRRFKATKTTKLTGTLTVAAQVKIAGRKSGKRVKKRFKGPVAAKGRSKDGAAPDTTPVGTPLVGTFKLDPGAFTYNPSQGSLSWSGTYFRMIDPGGNYLVNGSSPAPDKTYTPLSPGTDGGLRTDAYQPRPDPFYDSSGVLANRIVQRQLFFGAYFTIYTEPNDFVAPFTPIALPQISHQGGKLTGRVTAWVANWNKTGLFNQGTPKPDGGLPGATTPLRGTYDPASRHFTLEWTSEIVGGPFNGCGGYWHLEGTFEPAS